LNYLANKLRTAFAESFQRLVDIVHGEHGPEVAQSVDGSVPVIRDDRRCEEAGKFEPAVTVRRAHHCNLNVLIAQSRDTPGPFSFNSSPTFKIEAELAKEIDRRFEVIDDDSYIVHPFDYHMPNLQ
jgi:hypothetical protein